MWRVGLVGALLGACADVPAPLAFSDPPLVVTTDADGTHVKSATFELAFPATGVRLPNHLYNAAHADLLGTDSTCAAPSAIGIAVSPAITVAGGASASASDLEIVDAGPGIVKAHVTYASSYSCPDATQVSGATDFTIFPSGRIVREDLNVAATTTPLALSASCGCAASQKNFYFSSYWSFAGAGASQVETDGSVVSAGIEKACTMYADHGIAVSYGGTTTDFQLGATSTHFSYWTEDATSLETGTHSATSAINLGTAGQLCADIMLPLFDPLLSIAGQQAMTTGHDGIYRDTMVHRVAFDLETEATIAPGWAISVDLGGADHATITRRPDKGTTVGVPQREQGTSYLIYFPDGLAAGETITITPQ